MKPKHLLPLFAAMILSSCATDSNSLSRQIAMSGNISTLLPLDESRSLDAFILSKPVFRDTVVGTSAEDWSAGGYGRIEYRDGVAAMVTPAQPIVRPEGAPYDPDYATYGSASFTCILHNACFEDFNRIRLEIRPVAPGTKITNLNLSFNYPSFTVKDGYRMPGGAHLMNLEEGVWNNMVLEIEDLRRDSLQSITLHTSLRGRDRTGSDSLRFEVRKVCFEKTTPAEKTAGWQPMPGRIICSTTGYLADGPKTAIICGEDARRGGTFELLDRNGKSVFSGEIEPVTSGKDSFGMLDFSSCTVPGTYSLRTADAETEPFEISPSVFVNPVWRVLNYIFGQRCGYKVEGVHEVCHQDIFGVRGSSRVSFGGGWHDAGDLSQQSLQTGETALALLEASRATKDQALSERLIEEAMWGIRFVVQCHLGEGYHASSLGLLHWTDNIVGTADDITSVRVHDGSLDNYTFAGILAEFAAATGDESLLSLAEEDFRFAEDKFMDRYNLHPEMEDEPFFHKMEHILNTSRAQRMAMMSWSASKLYAATGNGFYARKAAHYMEYTLDCQQTEPLADGTRGFFYRDKERKAIVHFIHQSRDHVFAAALEALCRTQPEHPSFEKWKHSLRLIGDYLLSLRKYTAPYGMIPSGVYMEREYDDWEGFSNLHLDVTKDAKERFDAQIAEGTKIDEGFRVRKFPVWINIYSGNNAIILSSGKAAAIAGRYFGDKELLALGAEQLYWVLGKNPFGQSMIYGEGRMYPRMSSFSSGEFTGDMPVGIKADGDKDEPYWPSVNNACYKESWVSSAARWMSLAAEYME